MNTNERTRSRQAGGRLTILIAYFAGILLIVGWSLPRAVSADRPVEVATGMPDAKISNPSPVPSQPAPVPGRVRDRGNCSGCGVIESMQTIDTRDQYAGRCAAGETTGTHPRDHAFAGGAPEEVEPLVAIAAAAIAERQYAKRVALAARHRIVVRFPDGTRQVFDEATPRTLQVGDRIKVIAGASRAGG
jgi:hypothetical protein